MLTTEEKTMDFEELEKSWIVCRRCGLCETRNSVVLGRGCRTPFVVFLGEAPGRNEDHSGQPWVGPSGRFLEQALKDAVGVPFDLEEQEAYYLNVVACRPCDTRRGPNRAPTSTEITTCQPRVAEQLRVLRPVVVVRLGLSSQIATTWLERDEEWRQIRIVNLPHPAALLRRGGVNAYDYGRYVETLRSIWR